MTLIFQSLARYDHDSFMCQKKSKSKVTWFEKERGKQTDKPTDRTNTTDRTIFPADAFSKIKPRFLRTMTFLLSGFQYGYVGWHTHTVKTERNYIQACVQPYPTAVSTTCCWASSPAIDRHLLPAERSAANPLLLSVDGTDRRTDGWPFRRPCSSYYICEQCQ